MDLVSLILLLFGVTTAGIRLSWADRAWPAGIVALGWAGLPWISSDIAARTSAVAIRSWVLQPDHLGGVAMLLLIEALLGIWAAFQCAELRTGWRDRSRIPRSVVAVVPSPALALGLLGSQVALFNRVGGFDFSFLTGILSLSVALGLLLVAVLTRRFLIDLGARASLGAFLFVGLLLVGSGIVPLAQRPPVSSKGTTVDRRGTVTMLAVTIAGVGIGLLFNRWQATREGVGAR